MAEAETQLTDQQIEQELAAQTAPKEVEYKTETGQVFKGKDWEEIAQKMAQSVESGTRTIKEQRDREQYLLQQMQERQNQQVETKPKGNQKFDKLKYYQTWQEDPFEAEREVIRQILAEEFGADDFEQVKRGYSFSYQKAQELHQNAELAKFWAAHPEYQGSEDESGKLAKYLMDNGYEMAPERGKFIEAKDIEYAWYKLIESGEVSPKEPEETRPARPQAPPSLGGSGQSALPSVAEKVNQMSDKDLEAFLRQKGMLKY